MLNIKSGAIAGCTCITARSGSWGITVEIDEDEIDVSICNGLVELCWEVDEVADAIKLFATLCASKDVTLTAMEVALTSEYPCTYIDYRNLVSVDDEILFSEDEIGW